MRRALLSLALAAAAASAGGPVRARSAMVATARAEATDIGVAVLRSGGNAVDAAVAVGFALAVSHPAMCGLGGGFYMIVRTADGKSVMIDARERASERTSRDVYRGLDLKASTIGWKAAGVPGTVRGLELAWKKFGTRRWDDLVQPAATLARDGVTVTHWYEDLYRTNRERLSLSPDSTRIFLNEGRLFETGDTLRQPELATTLNRIATRGAADFYEGETAHRLSQAAMRNGGWITAADLATYRAVERAPLHGSYRGYEVIAPSPSSAGGVVVLETLGILEGSGFEKHGPGSAGAIHWIAEAMRRAYADRSEHVGDPDFVKVPVSSLLDRQYWAQQRGSIREDRATPSSEIRARPVSSSESAETTHYQVLDAMGNAVAVTYTLNSGFGSGVTAPGLGFLLNNNMDNFATNPGKPNQYGLVQGEANSIRPGKRPVSSMAPVILVKDGRVALVTGTPGGPTIPTAVIQAIINVVDFRMNAQEAIDRPRFHHQWMPDEITLEDGFSPDTIRLLEARGHKVKRVEKRNDMMAIRAAGKWIEGAADSRREGKAAGY